MTPVAEIARLERQLAEGIRRYPPNPEFHGIIGHRAIWIDCVPNTSFISRPILSKECNGTSDPKSIPSGHQLNSYLERTCRHATYARIKSYLLYTGPDFWGYSPVLPALSFDGPTNRERLRAMFT